MDLNTLFVEQETATDVHRAERPARDDFAAHTSATYNKVAAVYDDLFGGRVKGPHARLTERLGPSHGDRLADLACGTGVYTLEMARHVGNGEVVAVDHSENMLALARQRLHGRVPRVSFVQACAQDYIAAAESGAFDIVSMRFVLAYLDWRAVLPRVGSMVKTGGRVGVLTSLSSSLTQLQALIDSFDGSAGSVCKLLRSTSSSPRLIWDLVQLKKRLTLTGSSTLPGHAREVIDRLALGGLTDAEHWTETVRLWFASGREAVTWAVDSGYASHPALAKASPATLKAIEEILAQGMERFREAEGIPLDLVVSGVVARKR